MRLAPQTSHPARPGAAAAQVLKAAHNEIAEVTIEKLPRLKHLDLSHNKLDGIPDLSGFKATAQPHHRHPMALQRRAEAPGVARGTRALCALHAPLGPTSAPRPQALAHLDLSHNSIGTRPDSETSAPKSTYALI